MRSRTYRGSKRRTRKAGRRKSYRGGQPRWPAPSNPTPSVGCRFPHFRPLVLSQFGGRKVTKKYRRRKQVKRKSKTRRGANGDSPATPDTVAYPSSPPQGPYTSTTQDLGWGNLDQYGTMYGSG